MGKRTTAVVVAAALFWVNVKTEEMEEALQDAKDKAEPWSDWAYDKFSKGFGFKQVNVKEVSRNLMDGARDVASKATHTMNQAAGTTSRYASQNAGEAADAVEYGKEKAADAYGEVKQKIQVASEMASEKANQVKDAVEEAMGIGGEDDAFDEALKRVGASYKLATDSMTDQAKASYEAAKEKLIDATGDVGTKMRKDTSEL